MQKSSLLLQQIWIRSEEKNSSKRILLTGFKLKLVGTMVVIRDGLFFIFLMGHSRPLYFRLFNTVDSKYSI